MFLFSKKLLYLLVAVALVFSGNQRTAEGIERCLVCGDSQNYLCDGKNEVANDFCDSPTSACGWKKDGDKIYKLCALEQNLWDDGIGKPKNIIGKECWCIEDNCNAKPTFCSIDDRGSKGNSTGGGGSGGGGGGDAGIKGVKEETSGGAVVTIISPGLAVLFWFVTSVARFP